MRVGGGEEGAGLELNWNLAVSGASGAGLSTFCAVAQRLLRAYGALSRDAFVVLDAARLAGDDRAADTTHTGFTYPHGITKFDGDGLDPGFVAVPKYENTSDPVGRR